MKEDVKWPLTKQVSVKPEAAILVTLLLNAMLPNAGISMASRGNMPFPDELSRDTRSPSETWMNTTAIVIQTLSNQPM